MFSITCCSQCGHSFVPANPGAPVSERLYTDYYPRESFDIEGFGPKSFPGGFSSWLNGDASAAGKWVPPGVRILDIGCGFGETLAYHLARGCDAYGVEMDKNVRKAAEKFHFKVHIGPFNPDCYSPDFFDYVTLQQVIEHVDNPAETLKGVAQVLRPGGYVVLSTPNANGWGAKVFGRRWINWHVPYHRHFFSPVSMQIAAQMAGLQIEESRTVTNSEWLRYQWAHLLTLPPEGEPSAFWSPHGRRSWVVKIGQKLLDGLHYARINHLLTRLFDGLGVGDNCLLLLKKP
jgi:2-polyprenyl-3-methyl-5-hydroxy-6-metoxy-1,4-benzoquinol methylase